MILSDDFWSLNKDLILRAPLAKMETGSIKTKTVDIEAIKAKYLARKRVVLNEFSQEPGMGEFLCIGDYICLYCEETEGYVYSDQSSASTNGLCIYTNQDRSRPTNIPNQHVVLFQVCIQNRYKLNKKYRKWVTTLQNEGSDTNIQAIINQSQVAAEAENNDNELEQRRQHGKRVRYGEVVQLKHVLTGKFVHMSTTQTSKIDKNYMKVSLHEFNAKNAQFRILPRYKVKSEGEVVQLYDQIVFESVKSPGHYFHASEAHQIDYKSYGSELNLGVERSTYTLIGSFREQLEQERFVRGGSVIRLFHKELEAYLVAEGLFDDSVTEDVHFRIRVIDQHRPKSLSPSTSGITYWQVETEHSILDGDVLRWEQQIRLRHMLTRQYLCIDSRSEVSLIVDPSDPRTVFRLHSVLKEQDEIQYESYARIEHVLTGCWLHALKDEDYEKREFRTNDQEMSMYGLRWDGASTRKVSASSESMYDDAYTLQMVEKEDVANFNFVAGMVPFLFNLIQDFQNGIQLTAKKTHGIIAALRELRYYMTVDGQPDKDRQKLMRNLRVIDLLVKLLQCPLREGDEEPHMIRIFKEAYDVLHAYMIGKSRKNALYFAKYIDFFQTQFTQKGGIGLNVAQMIVELIRDKRKIVDRITTNHLDIYIELLRSHQNYRFLDLLQVLCVCDGVAIPNNQTYITEKWLRSLKDSVYVTDRGQNINKRPNIVYVSTNNAKTWRPLHEFVDPDDIDFDENKYDFLIHQLDLFKALTYGRNDLAIHVITREFGYLTWEDAFLCITSDLLPDSIRAKYCELIIGLFVDVGNNYSVLDNPNICFVYEYVGSKDSEREQSQFVPRGVLKTEGAVRDFQHSLRDLARDRMLMKDKVVKDLVTIFPVLRDWLAEFLNTNCIMTASDIGHNLLIEQVLRLLQHLVKFGYYSDIDDVKHLLTPLLSLLDGRHDVPFPKDKSKGYSKEGNKAVQKYRESGRFEPSRETEAIVRAKFQAMEVLDLLLTFQRNLRLKTFVEKFKVAEQGALKKRNQSTMEPLLYETFNPQDTSKKGAKKQKEVLKELKEMFNFSAIFEIESTTNVLMDLSEYKYDMMISKSLDILNKLYSSQSDMFKLSMEAQILLSQDSARVHREVQRSLPVLRRLAKQKLNDQQVLLMSEILDELAEFCHLPKTPHEPHFMNQNIMISHGILDIVLDILSQDIDAKLLQEQYSGMKKVFQKTLYLLRLLIRENEAVQFRIFNNLDILLDVQVVPSDLALALKEVFIANQATCLKVHSQQVKKIVLLAAEHQHEAPEFLDLLNVLVKVEGLDLTIKRNQALVMKYIMQNFKKAAYVLDQPREAREKILTNQAESGHLAFFAHLVDLLATCAEGENKFIESLCQTILPVEEILWVINHPGIDCNIKRPFIQFMMWVYMKPAENLIESGAADLQHHKSLWDFISAAVGDINQLAESVKAYPEKMLDLLKMSPSKSAVADGHDTKSLVHSGMFYILEGVMPFIEVFYTSFFTADKELYPDEVFATDSLANAIVSFCDVIGPVLTNPAHMKSLVTSLTAVVSVSSTPKALLISVLEKFTAEMKVGDTKSAVRRGNMEYYAAELELNAKFHMFAQNCSQVHVGHNTVQQQLKFKSKREFTEVGSNEELPLGEEFQNLVKCFINSGEKKLSKKYELAGKLLDQLAISAKKLRWAVSASIAQEELDVKCLQILRTLIHNEERKLPEDWHGQASDTKIKKQLCHIKDIQNAINEHDVVNKVLPHLARRSDAVAREVLAFASIMLFNANREVQKSLLDYFFSTREEVFFMAVRDRMQVSTNSIKEKRALLAQHEARRGDLISHFGSFQTSLTLGRKALQMIQHYELRLKKEKMHGWRALSRAKEPMTSRQRKKSKKRKKDAKKNKKQPLINGMSKEIISDRSSENLLLPTTPDKTGDEVKTPLTDLEMLDVVVDEKTKLLAESIQNTQEDSAEQMFAEMDESVADMLEYKDDGCIELVLKVLARICDGQHTGLQDYLREQPDNVKSFNIVGETAQFLNVVYSSINSRTIDLVIQLFSTLNEFCSGNQENRVVIYDYKAIDYINFILRAGDIAECPPEKVLELQEIIATLVMSLIEENGPGPSQVAKEVKDTIDKDAIYRLMTQCYEMHQSEKKKLEDLVKTGESYLQSAKSVAALGGSLIQGVVKGPKKNAMKESLMAVGFNFYLILARLIDVDPHMTDSMVISQEQLKAFEYYKKNCMSIEVVKDDCLQKVNFRVKNKILIREEVKEKLKWSVDRTSPSNKIRDLMDWTRDIMKDILYQKKILFNPIAIMFTKGWLLWNHLVTFLSFAINILMLITWNAKASMEDYDKYKVATNASGNGSFDWSMVYDPSPVIQKIPVSEYTITMYVLGGLHNLFSLFVLISYFLSNHPRLPTCSEITEPFRQCRGGKENNDNERSDSAEKPSKLDVKFFSFTTFYYMLFLAMSIAGTLFHGYFFAFHLLNIVNNNQLLGGVIKAVTQNDNEEQLLTFANSLHTKFVKGKVKAGQPLPEVCFSWNASQNEALTKKRDRTVPTKFKESLEQQEDELSPKKKKKTNKECDPQSDAHHQKTQEKKKVKSPSENLSQEKSRKEKKTISKSKCQEKSSLTIGKEMLDIFKQFFPQMAQTEAPESVQEKPADKQISQPKADNSETNLAKDNKETNQLPLQQTVQTQPNDSDWAQHQQQRECPEEYPKASEKSVQQHQPLDTGSLYSRQSIPGQQILTYQPLLHQTIHTKPNNSDSAQHQHQRECTEVSSKTSEENVHQPVDAMQIEENDQERAGQLQQQVKPIDSKQPVQIQQEMSRASLDSSPKHTWTACREAYELLYKQHPTELIEKTAQQPATVPASVLRTLQGLCDPEFLLFVKNLSDHLQNDRQCDHPCFQSPQDVLEETDNSSSFVDLINKPLTSTPVKQAISEYGQGFSSPEPCSSAISKKLNTSVSFQAEGPVLPSNKCCKPVDSKPKSEKHLRRSPRKKHAALNTKPDEPKVMVKLLETSDIKIEKEGKLNALRNARKSKNHGKEAYALMYSLLDKVFTLEELATSRGQGLGRKNQAPNDSRMILDPERMHVLKGVSLLWVAILGLIVIYIYSLVGFSLLRSYFAPGDYLYCSTLWQCTVTVIRYGLIGDMFEQVKQGETQRTFEAFWPIVLYHVSFFIFITTIGLNIIFGIIVDTFSELRDLKWRAESDMKDTCFICSRNSYDFEHHGKGFDYHVRNEHNMWSYVFFFIHLDNMKQSDYTAVELYVSRLLEAENYDFFPMNRALCLSTIDIDSTESKIDDLLHQVTSIAQKQRDDEAEKKRKVEKLKQKRWQEKHRRFIFGILPTPDGADTDREPLLPPSGRSDFPPPPPPNLLSISEDSDFYKEKRGSMSLIQILEGLPDDKSSRDTTTRSRILSITDIDSDSGDSVGSTGPADSYDLIKSPEGSQDKLDSDDQEPVVSISVPPVRLTTPPRDRDLDTPSRMSPPTYSSRRHSDSGSEDETLQATTRL